MKWNRERNWQKIVFIESLLYGHSMFTPPWALGKIASEVKIDEQTKVDGNLQFQFINL